MDQKKTPPQDLLEALTRLEPETLARAGFDAAKVKRIRAEIQAGRYATDAGKVADAMLRDVAALLEKHKKKPG